MSILEPESGIWYTLCWLVVAARLWSRRLNRGSWKKLQIDDFLVLFAMVTDTILMAFMHVVSNMSSNLIAPNENQSTFTPEEIKERIYGSKLVLVVEQMQILTIWLIKACLLIMYNRMTMLLPQHKIVKFIAVYVALGFLVMEILYFGVWCRPFHEYWAVPTDNKQCSAAIHHLITNAVFNISSDIMIILIPMPLLFKVRLPAKNKAILGGVFCIGTFTIIAAALNKYYSFSHPFAPDWTIWYLRESYTAILCANLPFTWPILQRAFNLSNWSQNSYPSNHYGGQSRSHNNFSQLNGTNMVGKGNTMVSIGRSDSQEHINKKSEPLEIMYGHEFTVQTVDAKDLSQASAMEPGVLPRREGSLNVDTQDSDSTGPKKAVITTTCQRF